MIKLTKNQENTLIAIGLIIFGLLLIIFPYGSLSIILRVIGAVILAFKVVKIVTVVRAYSRTPAYTVILVNEILIALLALILLINPAATIKVITLIIGVYLLITSFMRIWTYSRIKKTATVWFAITLDILTMIAGFWLLFHPASLAELVGIFLGIAALIKGLSMLFGSGLTARSAKNPKDDYITAKFRDKSDEK